jgi:3-hydroxyacyl-CoA dehydrogenase
MKRTINKVAVLGSGIMGSRIACHFANAGIRVLLLDIAPQELSDDEKKKGLPLDSPIVKNRIVNSSLQAAIKSSPSPLFKKSFASRITTGNFSDDMKDISDCDWVLEAVVENIDIKKKVFNEVEKYRKAGTLITSNTSGIPIHLMNDGRSEDFQKHFCGTHFFNPPRYLRLLEIIPTPKTSAEVVDFLMNFGDKFLGKQTVLCKDTPAFIANRIGIFSIMSLFHLVEKMGLTVDEVDKLTGTVIGRPKSATFRTVDVVGLDTLIKVADYLYASCPDDEQHETFKLPDYVAKVAANKWYGDKSGQGFYKKVKGADGKSEIFSIDLKTLGYKPKGKVKFATLEQAKTIDSLRDRIKFLLNGNDKAGEFYRASFYSVFQYISNRIPEIADDLYLIDDAICAGFGWELGPFEIWDALGVEETAAKMEAAGMKPAQWIYDMLKKGKKTFYNLQNGARQYYHIPSGEYKTQGGTEGIIFLDAKRDKTVWKNSGAHLIDVGDGILNLEFHTKMNTIGAEIIEGLNKSIEIAEKDFRGLVIANEAANFSAGANLALVFMLATEQEWEEIDIAIRTFQNTSMRLRYSSIPVVLAPRGLTLGGGCEMALHADKVVAAAETYIGLVEFGVGLIPGGGGSKEMALRASNSYAEGIIDEQILREYFLTIAMAKVSTSGYEGFDLNILKKGRDEVVMNMSRQVSEAKRACLEMADAGYVKPNQRTDVRVLGKGALAMFYAGANSMKSGHFISEHDQLISRKLAYVMCGGELSTPSLVSEQYLLDLEREAFLSLCGERKTLERIQSILTTGKPLRN